MKKNWKIIVGIIFLIGGFGCIGSDMRATVFGVLIGIALIIWWVLGRRRAVSNSSTVGKQSLSPVSPIPHPAMEQAAQVPSEPRAPLKAPQSASSEAQPVAQVSPQSEKSQEGHRAVSNSSTVGKQSSSSVSPVPHPAMEQAAQVPSEPRAPLKAPQSASSEAQPVAQVSPQSKKSQEGHDIVIPEKKDGASLAYRYSVPFVPFDFDAVLAVAKAESWYLSAKQIGQEIHLFSEGTDLGALTERADMVSDWIRRNEPYLIILERVNNETGCTVMLVFYRDKQKHYANKEQTITALTGYKSDAKQDIILSLNKGDELEAEEDYEKEGKVLISDMGEEIGSLPKRYAERFIREGASLIIFDHSEEEEESFAAKPFVKIFW